MSVHALKYLQYVEISYKSDILAPQLNTLRSYPGNILYRHVIDCHKSDQMPTVSR